MIEFLMIKFLDAVLDVPTFAERPEKPPKSYVIAEKTSSGGNFVTESTFTFYCYAETLARACKLSNQVKKILENTPPEWILKAEFQSDFNATETSTKKYRYICIFDIYHYKEV